MAEPVHQDDFLEFFFHTPNPLRGNAEQEKAPRALLSLKSAGDMKYDSHAESPARLALFRSLRIAPENVVGIELRHSRNVAFIDTKEDIEVSLREQSEGLDGIITRNPNLVPSVTVADCMPIYLFCEKAGAFGVLHSGWKGTSILKTAVEGLEKRYNCAPKDIQVILGPAIGACCYEVDEKRASNFAREFGASTVREVKQGAEVHFYIDLLAANTALARFLGITDFHAVHLCTCCDNRLASFRRDGQSGFTRMLALIMSPFPY